MIYIKTLNEFFQELENKKVININEKLTKAQFKEKVDYTIQYKKILDGGQEFESEYNSESLAELLISIAYLYQNWFVDAITKTHACELILQFHNWYIYLNSKSEEEKNAVFNKTLINRTTITWLWKVAKQIADMSFSSGAKELEKVKTDVLTNTFLKWETTGKAKKVNDILLTNNPNFLKDNIKDKYPKLFSDNSRFDKFKHLLYKNRKQK